MRTTRIGLGKAPRGQGNQAENTVGKDRTDMHSEDRAGSSRPVLPRKALTEEFRMNFQLEQQEEEKEDRKPEVLP